MPDDKDKNWIDGLPSQPITPGGEQWWIDGHPIAAPGAAYTDSITLALSAGFSLATVLDAVGSTTLAAILQNFYSTGPITVTESVAFALALAVTDAANIAVSKALTLGISVVSAFAAQLQVSQSVAIGLLADLALSGFLPRGSAGRVLNETLAVGSFANQSLEAGAFLNETLAVPSFTNMSLTT